MKIDTHCHIDQFPHPLTTVEAVERARVATVAVTNLPSHYVAGRPHVQHRRYMRLALGLHPLAAKDHARELASFLRLANEADYFGEVGLDFSREGAQTKDIQINSFRCVAKCLAQRHRFATLHARGAEVEVLKILNEHQVGPVIFHWFTGGEAELEQVLAAGHYVSVNPAMALSNRWGRLFVLVPIERVLTETDGPHVQVRGCPADPAKITEVLRWLAQRWMVDPSAAEAQVDANYQRLRSTWPKHGTNR